MCESTFENDKFRLISCATCGAEGSTACCMELGQNETAETKLCHNCEDES